MPCTNEPSMLSCLYRVLHSLLCSSTCELGTALWVRGYHCECVRTYFVRVSPSRPWCSQLAAWCQLACGQWLWSVMTYVRRVVQIKHKQKRGVQMWDLRVRYPRSETLELTNPKSETLQFPSFKSETLQFPSFKSEILQFRTFKSETLQFVNGKSETLFSSRTFKSETLEFRTFKSETLEFRIFKSETLEFVISDLRL